MPPRPSRGALFDLGFPSGAKSTPDRRLPSWEEPSPNVPPSCDVDAPEPYVFGGEIGRGGMDIMEAFDCKLGRSVAVKIMLSEARTSRQHERRFLNEAAILARLTHPNIVPVYNIGRDSEGQIYYTMKLVKGRTLQAILN